VTVTGKPARDLELKLFAIVKSQNHGLMLVSLFVLGLTLFWQGSYEILCRIIFQ